MMPSAEIKPWPHWWKASAQTTRPTLPSENAIFQGFSHGIIFDTI